MGFPLAKTTTLWNKIDINSLSNHLETVSQEMIFDYKNELNISGLTGIFLGSLTKEKDIPSLLLIAESVRKHFPNFTLIIAGDGPLESFIKDNSCGKDWIKLIGPVHGLEKALSLPYLISRILFGKSIITNQLKNLKK